MMKIKPTKIYTGGPFARNEDDMQRISSCIEESLAVVRKHLGPISEHVVTDIEKDIICYLSRLDDHKSPSIEFKKKLPRRPGHTSLSRTREELNRFLDIVQSIQKIAKRGMLQRDDIVRLHKNGTKLHLCTEALRLNEYIIFELIHRDFKFSNYDLSKGTKDLHYSSILNDILFLTKSHIEMNISPRKSHINLEEFLAEVSYDCEVVKKVIELLPAEGTHSHWKDPSPEEFFFLKLERHYTVQTGQESKIIYDLYQQEEQVQSLF